MSFQRLSGGAAFVSLLVSATGLQARCQVDRTGVFAAGSEQVRLARADTLAAAANVAMFRAPLAVNTDGAPTSYHPDDYAGARLAINHIENGIAIRRADARRTTSAERMRVFNGWRNSATWAVPAGYTISWRNVIAADGNGRPCIFRAGQHAGYFGSLTALDNGLSGAAAGECGVNNQLDQRFIPAIVLRGGSANPLHAFGARRGDLVLAINPVSGVVVPAIIGDTGNAERIGEGSVALNMRLQGVTTQPRTYRQAIGLDTGSSDMIVAVLPGTVLYRRERPYSPENLAVRVGRWAQDRGYGSIEGLAAAIRECSTGL